MIKDILTSVLQYLRTNIFCPVRNIVQINVVNCSSKVSDTEGMLMCRAIEEQVNKHVVPAWGISDVKVNYLKSDSGLSGGYIVYIVDEDGDGGSLGYHYENSNTFYGIITTGIIFNMGGAVLKNGGGLTVSNVLSHEILEMLLDSSANYWAEGPRVVLTNQDEVSVDADLYALEICDPVQEDSYDIVVNSVSVSVSNFVYPSWFNMLDQGEDAASKKYDYLGRLTAPYTMSVGGYMIMRSGFDYYSVYAKTRSGETPKVNAFHRRKKS